MVWNKYMYNLFTQVYYRLMKVKVFKWNNSIFFFTLNRYEWFL